MTPVNGDFDLKLRHALHAEVDSLEPAEGGLERIRRRTRAPWLVRQASLMLTECVDLARLIGIRLEPGFAGARVAIAARGGSRAAFVGLLSSTVAVLGSMIMPPRRRGAAHRSGPGGPAGPGVPDGPGSSPPGRGRGGLGRPGRPGHAGRPGSNLGWLRPVLAVTGAVVIVVAGVYGLAQVRDKLVLELFRGGGSIPASPSPGSSTGHEVPTLTSQRPPVIAPSGAGTTSAKPAPKATCSPTPGQRATPTPAPATTTPTPTTTPPTPSTPGPTDSTTPAPTTSTAGNEQSANAVSIRAIVTNAAPATPCGGPASSGRASGAATS